MADYTGQTLQSFAISNGPSGDRDGSARTALMVTEIKFGYPSAMSFAIFSSSGAAVVERPTSGQIYPRGL
jgi:hypothetical protein